MWNKWLTRPWRALRRVQAQRQQARLERRAIPDELWRTTLRRFPFLCFRSRADLARLRQLSSLFLAEKEFHTIGLDLSDDMAVAIAAQACLPVLKRELTEYQGFVGIVLHAGEVRAPRQWADDAGIVHEWEEELAGEAMPGGPIMLSWADVQQAGYRPADGAAYSVVIHECAHVLDMRLGLSVGWDVPSDASAPAPSAWTALWRGAYEGFRLQVEAETPVWLDPYAAESPQEFFAVMVEAFFVAPRGVLMEFPAIYRLLNDFFGQAPGAWSL